MKECKKGAGMVLGLVMAVVAPGCVNNEYRQPGSYSTTTVVQQPAPRGYYDYPLYNNPMYHLWYQDAQRRMYGPPPIYGGGGYGGGFGGGFGLWLHNKADPSVLIPRVRITDDLASSFWFGEDNSS